MNVAPKITSKINPKIKTPLYERDFVLWTEEQAKLLRAGKLDQLDLANLIEEVESLGRSDKRSLRSELDRLAVHLMKWRHQPSRRSRSWENSIVDARRKIELIVTDSPSLRAALPLIAQADHDRHRREAARQTRLPIDTFPDEPPFTLDQILDDDFWPD